MADDKKSLKYLWMFSIWGTVLLFAACIILGNLNQDEGWYLYGARLVSQGKLPFVDFATTQGPVMSYAYAGAQPLVEMWGLAGGRLFTALLGLLSVLGAAWLAFRTAKSSGQDKNAQYAALLTLVLLGINIYQVYFLSIVKTYALTSFLLVAGFLFLSGIETKRGVFMTLLSGVFIALAVGTRTSAGMVLPVVFVFLLIHAVKIKNVKYLFVFSVAAAGILAAVFLPFYLKAREAFMFGLLEYHAGREVGSIASAFMLKAGSLCRLVGAYFTAFVFAVAVCVWKMFHRQKDANESGAGFPLLTVIFASAVAVAMLHLTAPFPYDEYQVFVYPVLCVVISIAVVRVCSVDSRIVVTAVLLLSLGGIASSSVLQSWFITDVDRLWVRERKDPQLYVLQEVARKLNELAGESNEILTQDIYLAVESGLEVPRGLELGPFSYFPEFSDEKARKCHVLNKEMMMDLFKTSSAEVVAISGYGFTVKAPGVTELTSLEQSQLWTALKDKYVLYKIIRPFGQSDTALGIFQTVENAEKEK